MWKKGWSVFVLLSTCLCSISFGAITLRTSPSGDAMYAWNSKYGPYGYTIGTNEMGVGLSMGGSYGNDYTISIFEIPIAALSGQTITSAILEVESLGFDTGYWYGSAGLRWVDTGTMNLTGDVVADNLGPAAAVVSIEYYLFNSGTVEGTPGIKQFDVLNHLLDDLAAGRTYTTFVLCGSRDTGGAIYTAESGRGPQIIAVPEPTSLLLLAFSGLLTAAKKRRTH
ncbi:MAG TPA: PEP-CTERM sorting domain-containing protein [Anaerohalosphaeraceae bacterium]|nr:PEP-CTERM sorting domain-containing protein [Anaerohalosphaeraceae bacterium]